MFQIAAYTRVQPDPYALGLILETRNLMSPSGHEKQLRHNYLSWYWWWVLYYLCLFKKLLLPSNWKSHSALLRIRPFPIKKKKITACCASNNRKTTFIIPGTITSSLGVHLYQKKFFLNFFSVQYSVPIHWHETFRAFKEKKNMLTGRKIGD